MTPDIQNKVISIVAMLKKVPVDQVRPDTSLEQLGFDSLDKINLLFELESAFNIDIPDDQVQSIVTVGDMIGKLEAIGANPDAGLNTGTPSGATGD